MTMSVEAFFGEFVPEKLAQMKATFPEIGESIQFEMIGNKSWVGCIKDGKPTFAEGTTDSPIVHIAFTEKGVDLMLSRVEGQLDKLKGEPREKDIADMKERLSDEFITKIKSDVNGTLKFTITAEDGGKESVAIGFNGMDFDQPTTEIFMKEEDALKMQESGGNPMASMTQMFLGGKIRIEGDMSFAMKLGTLM